MREVDFSTLQMNPYTLFDKEWPLITAGTRERGYNTMTVSWGQTGSLWGHKESGATVVVYVRPQRYTKSFVDREELFTLSFLPEKYKKELAYLGTRSGRDGDKFAACGITPLFTDGTTAVKEARMVLVCKKLFRTTLKEEDFIDPEVVAECYPERDFHDLYIARIEKCYVSDEDVR